jgi:hypothetical protein
VSRLEVVAAFVDAEFPGFSVDREHASETLLKTHTHDAGEIAALFARSTTYSRLHGTDSRQITFARMRQDGLHAMRTVRLQFFISCHACRYHDGHGKNTRAMNGALSWGPTHEMYYQLDKVCSISNVVRWTMLLRSGTKDAGDCKVSP